jgi:hypothetical protein
LPEDEWHTCEKLIFFPDGRWKKMWDFVVLGCVMYSCVMVPYRLAFEDAVGNVFWFEQSIMLLFIVDVRSTEASANRRACY